MFEISLCAKSILVLANQESTIEAKDFNQVNQTFIQYIKVERNAGRQLVSFLDEFPDCGITTFSSRFCHLIISQNSLKMLSFCFE